MPEALRTHLVQYFEEHQKLLEAGALQLILSDTEPLLLSRDLLAAAGSDSPFVTRPMVEAVLAHRSAAHRSGGGRSTTRTTLEDPVRPAEPGRTGFRLLAEGFTESATGAGPLGAYEALFSSRYRALARFLRGRPDLPNLRRLSELRGGDPEASVIAMVREVRPTSVRKHLILTVEDESAAAELLVPRASVLGRPTFLPDEVLGFRLSVPRERGRLPRVVAFQRPEVPYSRPQGRAPDPWRVLFLSDLHIGSRSFLSDAWAGLVDFLHEKGPRPELAREVAYVVVAGDLVDGIGIYPKQERDLAIEDVFEQYQELGRRLGELPRRIEIIVVPGNHDAVCPAEPQPGLPSGLRAHLPPNVRALGNPATFALDGVVIEAYHGRSFDDLIPAIPGASYARPTDVMKHMLAMRHLAPIYGGRTPLAPLFRDGLVIDPAPDILVTGHAHTYGVDQYRGILLLNASTWQAETEYQRMRNISPVPARAALVDLQLFTLETLDCSGPSPRLGPSAA